jgi:hypothetical protein
MLGAQHRDHRGVWVHRALPYACLELLHELLGEFVRGALVLGEVLDQGGQP